MDDSREFLEGYSTFYLPKAFLKSDINENFIKEVMDVVFGGGEWVRGDANKKEPDYFFNGIPFEFTIASNSCKANNYIQQLKKGEFSSENVEDDVIGYIHERVEDKSHRNYSVPDVNLCVLCLTDMTFWVFDAYGSQTAFLFDSKRKNFFKELIDNYVASGKFSNIFLLFPDSNFSWWVWDVVNNKRVHCRLTDEAVTSRIVPFVCPSHLFPYISGGKFDK